MKHRHAALLARGFTLVEMMVVIALIGLIASATAVEVYRHWAKGQEDTTRIAARNLRDAATQWRIDRGVAECPSAKDLRESHFVDRGARIEDAWGKPFAIECDAEGVTVVSDGRDRRANTPDDLREPPAT